MRLSADSSSANLLTVLFEQALIHPGVKFEIVFGVSGSNWPLYDVEHGKRAIGYEPQDYSEVPEEEWGR